MNTINYNKLGYIAPHNLLGQSTTPTPVSFMTDVSALPVLMQALQPDCVENFVTWAKTYLEYKKTGFIPDLSVRFLFDIAYPSPTNNQNGTSIYTALLIAYNIGICENQYLPNDTLLPNDQFADNTRIPIAAFQNSLNHKINAFQVITSDISVQRIKYLISQFGFVGVGLQIDQNWWTPDWPRDSITPITPPSGKSEITGHMVALIGYDENNNFYGINWWSAQFGDRGVFKIGANYVPFIYELAIVT